MYKLAQLIAVLAVAGCATNPATVQVAEATPAAAAASGADRQVCRRETIIGSYRSQTVCFTPGGPDDPNIAAATADLSRQMGGTQAMMGRAGGH